jgi:large subunit ribosomal protein L9
MMDVILLERVEHLGELGEQVKVKPGYARNYLIPKGKATEATPANVAAFEARRAELEKAVADTRTAAEAARAELEGVTLTISSKVGSEGRLFGSVAAADVVLAASRLGVELKKSQVRMAEHIRQIGEYDIELVLHSEVRGKVKVEVVSAE